MPLGFSGGNWLSQMGERYGDKLAKGIVQTGAIIEENLMKMQTNRQLTGLGQGLSQLNPQSAEYPNQLIELGTAFPMAMQDRRGQFLMSIGAKANAEWQAQERAKAQSEATFKRQKSLLGMRNQNRIGNEVDLLGGAGLPAPDAAPPMESAPPTANTLGLGRVGLPGLGAALDLAGGQPQAQATPQPQTTAPSADGTSALKGMSGGLGDAAAPLPKGSSANRAALRETDSLLGRALGPLREAQQLTGKKPTQAQLASAVAAEKRAEQQRAMQEDRQRQQEAMQTEREAEAEKKRVAAEEKTQNSIRLSALKTELSGVERDLAAQRTALNNILKEQAKKDTLTDADHALRTDAQAALETLGAERTRLNDLLKSDAPEPAARRVLKYNPTTRRLE